MGSTTDESHDLILDRFQSLFPGFEQKKFPHEFLKNELTYYAKRSGFLIDKYRKQAWKIVVDPSIDDVSLNDDEIKSEQYYEQIKLDAIRTLKRFPPNYSEEDRHDLQDELILLINKILIHHPELHYYQGYHDICLTFLLVLGKESCFPIVDSVTMSHLKYFMEPTIAKTHHCLSYLMPLINCIDSECAEFIQRGDNGHVTFALPWLITWYSHVLEDLELILRLYDLFIVSHYLMPIYLAAQIVDYHAEQILSLECEMATLHHYLSSLATELDRKSWEEIINRALYLFETHPPDALEDLAEQWKLKCEYIDHSPRQTLQRRSSNKSAFQSTVKSPKLPSLSNLALLGLSITVGGLAVYLWHQTPLIHSSKFLTLGDL